MNKTLFVLIAGIAISAFFAGCASKAKIVSNFNPNPDVINQNLYDEVIVTNFNYSTMRQTSRVTGSSSSGGYVTNYYEVLKEYTGGEISKEISNMLNRNGIKAKAMKNVKVEDLGDGQALLTGELVLFNYGSFRGWEIIPFFIGVGNILPAPWGFKVGAFARYKSEIVNSDGEILYMVPEKTATATYKHWWIWGAVVFSKRDFEKACDLLAPIALDEMLKVFEDPSKRPKE
mgnify:CR=1 FL=1